jgi:hypothetical protein
MSHYALEFTYAAGLNFKLDMGHVIGVLPTRKAAEALCAARANTNRCKYNHYTAVNSDTFLKMLRQAKTVSDLTPLCLKGG